MALSSTLVSLGILIGVFSLLALGLNLKFGYTGLLDIGHVAFFLVGAYLTALLVAPPAETQEFARYILGWNLTEAFVGLVGPALSSALGWLLALAVGTVGAGILGLLVALPAIRLREDYLAIAVLGISVILQRIVQSESWLANGPDSLRGYPLPLIDLFPLPGEGLSSALLLGLIVGAVWIAAAVLIARAIDDRENWRDTVVHGLFVLTTLGIGYAAARLARRNGEDSPRPVADGASEVREAADVEPEPRREYTDEDADLRFAVLGGILAGALATAGTVAGFGLVVVFVFFGAASLFTWAYGGVLGVRTFGSLPRRDVLVSLGLTAAFVLALSPVITLAGTLGLVGTLVGLSVFVYGTFYLGTNWDSLRAGGPFVRVLGLAAVWLFILRYFVLSLVTPLTDFGIGAAQFQLSQNVLWLVKFTPSALAFDYTRFLLAATFAAVGACYYLLERTVDSPFGRVLKAIREDEDVATALGKNTFVYKVQGMVLGSAVAGLAGGLAAIYYRALTFTLFDPRITFIAFLMVVIGGVASNRGAILGAVIYWGFWQGTTDLAAFFPPGARSSVQALRLAVFGALFVAVLYYRPQGILGENRIGGS
jgi:ABC-type branched-subunit amino acid transport system permease subunit